MKPCGTVAAWHRHYRAGEPPCEPCRLAWNTYCRACKKHKDHSCSDCGARIRRGVRCRPCCQVAYKRIVRGQKPRPSRRERAMMRAQRAAAGTKGGGIITNGPCNWCGEWFTSYGKATPARFCSLRCKQKAGAQRRRAREAGAHGQFTWTQVVGLFLKFDRRCAYCSTPIAGQPDPDHVVPLSRGGANSIHNILPCCKPCNSDKRDLLLDEWASDRARRGLAPVRTSWDVTDSRFRHVTSTDPVAA